jgi:hypothetical protein
MREYPYFSALFLSSSCLRRRWETIAWTIDAQAEKLANHYGAGCSIFMYGPVPGEGGRIGLRV